MRIVQATATFVARPSRHKAHNASHCTSRTQQYHGRDERLPRIRSHGLLTRTGDREGFPLDVLVLALKLCDQQRWNAVDRMPAHWRDVHLSNEIEVAVVDDPLGPDALDLDQICTSGVDVIVLWWSSLGLVLI